MGGESRRAEHAEAPGAGAMALLERDRETALLEGAIARAAEGSGAVVAIEGEPGIGKSELIGAAGELAERRSIGVHAVRAGETERGFAHGVARELAESILRDADAAPREPAPGDAARQLLELVDPARRTGPAELLVTRGFHQLVAEAAATRPLLLGIDDVHWADLPSLRVLLYLARRIGELPAVLCVATRPPAAADPSSPLVDALLAEAGARVLGPEPLSLAAAATMVSRALGDDAEPAFCGACHEATGGNPLLLRELIRGLASEGVEPIARQIDAIPRIGGRAVSRTVRLRLGHLPGAATELARAAAILGDGTPVAHAARIAGLDPEAAYDAAAGLGQLEILAGGSRAAFVHPLVREAVLSELSPVEAAALHASAARMLAELGEPPERLAEHLLQSPPGGSPETARILREVGNAAAAAGDATAGAEFLARALDEPAPESDRAAILLELAAAERHVDADAARARVDTALGMIEDAEERAAAALQLAELLPAIDPRRTIEVIEPQIELFADPETRTWAQAIVLTGALLAPDLLPRAREVADALRPELGAGTPAGRMATSLVGYLDALENRPASEVVPRLEAAMVAPLDPPQILGQLIMGMIALVAGDSPVALSVSDEWSALANETGFPGQAAGALMCRSHALLACGRLDEAIADAREGVEVSDLYVGGAPVNWTAAALVEGLIESGEVDEAERIASRIAPTGAPEWTIDLHGLLSSQTRLAALRGDLPGALERTLDLGRRCEDAGIRNPALVPWRSSAALLLSRSPDRAERALELVVEEVELARIWGAPRALGRALRTLGLVSPAGEAIGRHEEAVAVLDGSPARLELARATLELGAALRRRGKRAAARERLQHAAELAEACSAAPVSARAREELAAAGARPRRTALSGPESLTPQQRRVAVLAAEGLSNQEIAELLYLTDRTVESHLSNAYRKLGISSRSQLSNALAS